VLGEHGEQGDVPERANDPVLKRNVPSTHPVNLCPDCPLKPKTLKPKKLNPKSLKPKTLKPQTF
jgi:hypothetical protein